MKNFNIEINTNKQILSSESKIYKTESFFYQTKKLAKVDTFILNVAEGLLSITDELLLTCLGDEKINAFQIDTFDKSFSFFVRLGFQCKNVNLSEKDIIFYKTSGKFDNIKNKDQRLVQYLKTHKIFNVIVKPIFDVMQESDFKKIYLVMDSEFINIPMLNEKQQQFVELENKNLLIQGVAGSGKTNVCLSKIIWTACKNYTGKILYTTFSRGLLIDTKNKIELFKNNIKSFIDDYKNNRILFLDKNHKKAIENRLGLILIVDNESNIVKKLYQIVDFLENNIDYFLFEDFYKTYVESECEIFGEKEFLNVFLKNLSNHQLKSRLDKIKNLSLQIVYKEIYGMIFGCDEDEMMSFERYKSLRQSSFSSEECEVIYGIAKLFIDFQKTQNVIDNNIISRKLLKNIQKLKKYTLSIIDEVQDFTQINLKFLNEISIKMFCVGDALQMINPSYFSFAYLKKLMYNEDVTEVAELESNYRNNKKIVEILNNLSEINIKQFGTHSFVLSGNSIDENTLSNAVYINDKRFFDDLKTQKYENFTIIVSDFEQKKKLREIFKKQEILTVSEIKGLERETVLLYDILSSNEDKWKKLELMNINHKQADENSVFRFFFNLFYVALSRAKHNLFVYEESKISIFDEFFRYNFEILDVERVSELFASVIGKIEIDEDEIYSRIAEFIKLGQFDNARFFANKLESGIDVDKQLAKIDIFENYVFKGKNKDAGIALWKAGLSDDAKEQFAISGDEKLIDFIDRLQGRNAENLDADIVRFFVDFDENDDAQKLILDVVKQDLEELKNKHKTIKNKLKEFKEKYNGK